MSTATLEAGTGIAEIVGRYPSNRGSLITVLQDIQGHLGYLSEEAVDETARLLNISANEIYGVATFYTQFRFTPPAEHTIHLCQGTACHVRGSAENLERLEELLGVRAGEMTPDGKFELARVACLGCCALAPVVAIDGKVYAHVTPKKLPLFWPNTGLIGMTPTMNTLESCYTEAIAEWNRLETSESPGLFRRRGHVRPRGGRGRGARVSARRDRADRAGRAGGRGRVLGALFPRAAGYRPQTGRAAHLLRQRRRAGNHGYPAQARAGR